MTSRFASFCQWPVMACLILLTSCGDRQAASLEELAEDGYTLSVAEYHRAASGGDVNALERFVKAGVRVDIRDREGETALHHAAAAGKEEAVAWLLAQGCNLQNRSKSNESILHAAVTGGNGRVVESLMKAGVQPDNNDPLLVLGARLGHLELCQMLLETCRPQLNEAFLEAAASGRMAVTDFLLKQGANAFATRPPNGVTALMLAAQNNHQRMVEYLLQNGANRFALDAEGRCAYRFASSAGAADCVAILAAKVSLEERDLGLVEDKSTGQLLSEVKIDTGSGPLSDEPIEGGVKPLALLPKLLGPADTGTDVISRLRLRTVREAMAPLMIAQIQPEKATLLLLASGGSLDVGPDSAVGETGWRLVRFHLAPEDMAKATLPAWMYPHVELQHVASRQRRIGLVAVPVRAGESRALLMMEARKGGFEARVGDKIHLTGALQEPWEVVSISPASIKLTCKGETRLIGPHGAIGSDPLQP